MSKEEECCPKEKSCKSVEFAKEISPKAPKDKKNESCPR
jgi:hypothetical protein